MGKKIHWQRIPYRFLYEVFTKDEYRTFPPSRKYIPFDLYSPTLKNEKSEGCVVVAVDVSGSMSREDIKEVAEVDDEALDKILTSLEEKGLVKLYRDRKKRIAMAKATYEGLRKTYPPEHYRWFPKWYKEEDRF